MKAIRFHQHGGPDVLRYEDAPDPALLANDVLVRVRACALNHLDLAIRAGVPAWHIPMPHIAGADVSGEVIAGGSAATRFKSGERVMLFPAVSCRHCEMCLKGLDSACREFSVLGVFTDGGYAEYIKVPEINVVPIPGDLTFEEAAAVPLVFLTAWHMLVTRAQLKPGEDVLVVGAGSGVGSAAVQIAKMLHARVIATAGADWKLDEVSELGADDIINHSCQSIREEMRRLTGKRGVDVVVEHVGAAVWEDCFESLATYGRLVTCGMTTGADLKLNGLSLFGRQRTVLGSFMGGRGEFLEVLKFIGQRKLKAVIDSEFALAEAAAAQEKMEGREFFGKILLHP